MSDVAPTTVQIASAVGAAATAAAVSAETPAKTSVAMGFLQSVRVASRQRGPGPEPEGPEDEGSALVGAKWSFGDKVRN